MKDAGQCVSPLNDRFILELQGHAQRLAYCQVGSWKIVYTQHMLSTNMQAREPKQCMQSHLIYYTHAVVCNCKVQKSSKVGLERYLDFPRFGAIKPW